MIRPACRRFRTGLPAAGTRVLASARAPFTFSGLLALLVLSAGCNIFGPLAILTAPRQIQKAEFKLTHERLAVLIDYARPGDDNPVFAQAFHERLAEIFREEKVNEQLVPFEDVQRLRQQTRDFANWSVQKIGRELGATQVLVVRLERLSLRPRPEHPILEPVVEMRVKVIGTDAPENAPRLWPSAQEREARLLTRTRPPVDQVDPVTTDAEAAKLGRDAGLLVAMHFYDVDKEEPTPWEK